MTSNYIGKTCPYCQFPIKQDSEVVQCRACQAPHHRDCWEENGGCTTFGCRGTTCLPPGAGERVEIHFDKTPAGEKVPARTGGSNKLLVTALSVSLLVLVVVLIAYINLLSDRTAAVDDEPAVSPGKVKTEEEPQTFDADVLAGLDAEYYIDYENGTIPIGDLPIGARVGDPSWEWEFRTGQNYAGESGDETKPVTWIVVAKDHYEGLEPHVTLLSEELIGRLPFDNSTHVHDWGYNHWGESGTHSSADRGLRPWLNSTGIHSDEGFHRAFSESFKRAVLATTVPNKEGEDGSTYSTSDHVFIPSTTELGDDAHSRTYSIGSVYAYFVGADNAERVARLGEDARWYRTRSPETSHGYRVRRVSSDGAFGSHYAYGAYGGVRPALNLKSEIVVSEINH